MTALPPQFFSAAQNEYLRSVGAAVCIDLLVKPLFIRGAKKLLDVRSFVADCIETYANATFVEEAQAIENGNA
jgi:hypothetical protein